MPFHEGRELRVELIPLARRSIPSDSSRDSRKPIVLVDEKLSLATGFLHNAVIKINRSLGFGSAETRYLSGGVSFLVHLYLIRMDFYRSMSGKESILKRRPPARFFPRRLSDILAICEDKEGWFRWYLKWNKLRRPARPGKYPFAEIPGPVASERTLAPVATEHAGGPSENDIANSNPRMDPVWRDVFIAFVSNDSISVKIGKQRSKVYTFVNAGFKDGRKGDRPNTRWDVLLQLAVNRGTVSHNDLEYPLDLTQAVATIRVRLKKLLGIGDNPIKWDQKEHQYVAQFTIQDNRKGLTGSPGEVYRPGK